MKSRNKKEVECPLCGRVETKTSKVRSHIGSFPISIAECPICGLAFQHPKPSQEESKKYFNWRYKESVKGKSKVDIYLSDREFTLRIAQARISWIRSLTNGHRHLDIGTGLGALIYASREAGFEATGIEQSSSAVSKAKEIFGIKNIQTDIVDFSDDEAFDIVTAYAVIEHVRDPFVFLKAAFNHIVAGGVFIIETMNYNSWQRLLMGKQWYFFLYDHLYYFSPETLRIFLERSGFENIQMHVVPPKANITLSKNYHTSTDTSDLAQKIKFALRHPFIALRYPMIKHSAKKLWPQHWKREILLMTAQKPR